MPIVFAIRPGGAGPIVQRALDSRPRGAILVFNRDVYSRDQTVQRRDRSPRTILVLRFERERVSRAGKTSEDMRGFTRAVNSVSIESNDVSMIAPESAIFEDSISFEGLIGATLRSRRCDANNGDTRPNPPRRCACEQNSKKPLTLHCAGLVRELNSVAQPPSAMHSPVDRPTQHRSISSRDAAQIDFISSRVARSSLVRAPSS
jgi:hypothetical protein